MCSARPSNAAHLLAHNAASEVSMTQLDFYYYLDVRKIDENLISSNYFGHLASPDYNCIRTSDAISDVELLL